MPKTRGATQKYGRQHFGRFASLFLILSGLLVFCFVHSANAVTSISESYLAQDDIPVGSIVSLRDNTSDQIVAATTKNAGNVFGVTINSGSSLLSISSSKGKQVQVATGGTVPVLVSDYNGAINQGDSITASPIAGVGMKATANIRIIGLAQADLRKGNQQPVKLSNGDQKNVLLGQIPVLVGVSYYFKEPDKSIIPQGLQSLANGIAGKNVDNLPIIVSAAIFVMMLIVVIAIIYTMIRSSIISIGRNPMSQSSVYRNLIQLSALVLGILTVGIGAIFLVLTKL